MRQREQRHGVSILADKLHFERSEQPWAASRLGEARGARVGSADRWGSTESHLTRIAQAEPGEFSRRSATNFWPDGTVG